MGSVAHVHYLLGRGPDRTVRGTVGGPGAQQAMRTPIERVIESWLLELGTVNLCAGHQRTLQADLVTRHKFNRSVVPIYMCRHPKCCEHSYQDRDPL